MKQTSSQSGYFSFIDDSTRKIETHHSDSAATLTRRCYHEIWNHNTETTATMKTTFALISVSFGAAAAFTPSISSSRANANLGMSSEASVETPVEAPAAPAVAPINGWVPDSSKPCFGLPGAIAPLGYFDPLGFCNGRELAGVKRFREAEIMHSRVAMMATVGYLLAENTPTIAYGFEHPVIGNDMVPDVPGTVLFPFFLTVNVLEALRANIGWVEPGLGPLFMLRENYYPGDLGFDPLGLKPKDAAGFASMQAKELSNGRLAMLAAAGMCVQELVTGKPLLDAF
jgi:Chlorophyll A-B binding protein